MTIDETTLADLQDACLTNRETRLNQTVPLQARAYLRVDSVVMAANLKALHKRVTYAQLQALAATAKKEALRAIARDYGEDITPATKARFTVQVVAGSGDSVSVGAELTSDATGAYYYVTTGGSESAGYISFVVDAQIAGEDANLAAGETLTFTSSNGRTSGVEDTGTITTVDVTAEDEESLESFRRRVLNLQRKTSGGGNIADYRDWAESVSGVKRAYVYSGKPIAWHFTGEYISFNGTTNEIQDIGETMFVSSQFGSLGIGDLLEVSGTSHNDGYYTVISVDEGSSIIQVSESLTTETYGAEVTLNNLSQPGDRTVFVESEDESADYIPDEDLLEDVRDGINYDSDGVERPGLGDVDSTLYVEAISHAEFIVTVYTLAVDSTQEDACKEAIETDLETYFNALIPYMEGLDFEFDRNDTATMVSISAIVQNVLQAYGATADYVGLEVDGESVTSYQLEQGQTGKYGSVVWED